MLLNSAQIAEIRERVQAASEGPWKGDRLDGTIKYQILDGNGRVILETDNDEFGFRGGRTPENEAFVLNARTDIPALLDTVEALREALETISTMTDCQGPGCPFCNYDEDEDDGDIHGPSAEASIALSALAALQPPQQQEAMEVGDAG